MAFECKGALGVPRSLTQAGGSDRQHPAFGWQGSPARLSAYEWRADRGSQVERQHSRDAEDRVGRYQRHNLLRLARHGKHRLRPQEQQRHDDGDDDRHHHAALHSAGDLLPVASTDVLCDHRMQPYRMLMKATPQ